MSGRITNSYIGQVMDRLFGNASFTPPATYYFGLSLTTPANDGTNISEPTYTEYERVAVPNNSTSFPATGTDRTKTNGTVISFPAATDVGGVATHAVIWSHATSTSSSNVVAWLELVTPVSIVEGAVPKFGVGDLTFSAPGD